MEESPAYIAMATLSEVDPMNEEEDASCPPPPHSTLLLWELYPLLLLLRWRRWILG
jgi:hypothetical protein